MLRLTLFRTLHQNFCRLLTSSLPSVLSIQSRDLSSRRGWQQVTTSSDVSTTNLINLRHDSPTKDIDDLSSNFKRGLPLEAQEKPVEKSVALNENLEVKKSKAVTNIDVKANYSYFSQLAANVAVQTTGPGQNESKGSESQIETNRRTSELNLRSETPDEVLLDDAITSVGGKPPVDVVIKPPLAKKSFNLAAYVNESETLSNLVHLGVDLSRIESNVELATFLVKLDLETGVKPYLTFLHDVGVANDDIGTCVTRNADIFRQSLDDLQVRVTYLKSKRFSREAIARIVAKAPGILSQPVKQTDAQLGFIQRLFMLNGDELRQVIARHPKIALWPKLSIKLMKLTFKEMLGFTDSQAKQILLAYPKLYLSDRHAVTKRFNYLNEVIGFSREDLLVWPQILRTRVFIMRQRHEFLKLIGRDQFDPTRENYVSVKLLVLGSDAEFCANVAKTSVKRYNDFLKTL